MMEKDECDCSITADYGENGNSSSFCLLGCQIAAGLEASLVSSGVSLQANGSGNSR